MKTRTQNLVITHLDATIETFPRTHIYAEDGCFLRRVSDGEAVGWHIQLGTNDVADNYEDVAVDGQGMHDVPNALPDINVEEKATEGAE